MQLYKELNIFEDKKLYVLINIASVVVLAVTAFIMVIVNIVIFGEFNVSITLSTMLWAIILFFLSLILHEFIHGLFFRIYSPTKETKVKYGFTKGMFYATNPGVVYKKWQFTIIVLAPFVINSILFLILYLAGVDGTAIALLFIIHTAGCAGDFWYIYEMIRHPAISHCEDTLTGVKFFVREDG